jgi:hypothetical protein
LLLSGAGRRRRIRDGRHKLATSLSRASMAGSAPRSLQ